MKNGVPPKLDNCPFCGSKAGYTIFKKGRSMIGTPYWRGYVKCKNSKCGAGTPLSNSPEASARVWNSRVHKKDFDEAKESLADMCNQFGYDTSKDGKAALSTGGLSALECAFDVLGWSDPHPIPEQTCDEPGCDKRSTCGTPTPNGYRRTCGKHPPQGTNL